MSMANVKVVGLTGGIGSGKTSVSQIFELLGVPVYNSDLRAKILMEQNPEIKEALLNQFGDNIYLQDGSLNRKYLSIEIFNDKKRLNWVNALVHPAVGKDFDSWKSKQNSNYVIKESALLIETLKHKAVDKIIVVIASKKTRLSRVKQRDHLTESSILKRMENQIDDATRQEHADFVILNEGNHSIIHQTLKVFQDLNKTFKI
jgi:dephospho-CoA kinase